MVFIAVNTPVKEFGVGCGRAADMTYVEQSARLLVDMCRRSNVIVVEKSTVPVRCSETISTILTSIQKLQENSEVNFTILSNPEFLAEGTAIDDLLNPSRVLIGGNDSRSIKTLSALYECWVPRDRIIVTSLWSSELSKLVSNAFLAQRVSSINSITAVCERTGADVQEVSNVLSSDHRIGSKFLLPSIGFGGSCFRKDILHLVYICECHGLDVCAEYWMSVLKMNDYQMSRFCDNVVRTCFHTVSNKVLAIYGFAFKKNTGDTRDSPAIHVCTRMLEEGAILHVYDPKVSAENVYNSIQHYAESTRANTCSMTASNKRNLTEEMKNNILQERVRVMSNPIDAVRHATAVLILTDWDEFKSIDYNMVYNQMEKPAFLFDGRIVTNVDELRQIGFRAYCIGKSGI